jgi:hypothetical protein
MKYIQVGLFCDGQGNRVGKQFSRKGRVAAGKLKLPEVTANSVQAVQRLTVIVQGFQVKSTAFSNVCLTYPGFSFDLSESGLTELECFVVTGFGAVIIVLR